MSADCTVHAQFDAQTGLFPCCGAHYLERLMTGDAMDTDPELVTCGKVGATRLTDDERAALICDVGCESHEHRQYCAASIPDVWTVEIDAPGLVARVESILATREATLRETIEQAVAPRQDVLYPPKWAFGASANYEMGVRDERRRLRTLLARGQA